MEYKELDFQEHGIPANNDRVLIVEVNDEGKAVGAKNYNLSELKDFIDADALAYLEECRLIDTSVRNIAIQSEKLLDDTRGETIESLEQTVTSTEPGGVNVFTITQKNGSQKSLQTRNGLRGPEGPQGPAVPLVQTTGQSTTEAMSQKAVSDEFNQLKSDLVAKASMLSYEEIMASTPPIDLDIGIPKAGALKEIGGRIICGRSDFPATSTKGKQSITVNFGVTLPNVPKEVLISWADSQSDLQNYCLSLMANRDSYTTTGFQAITHRNNTGGAWRFNWIAIY